MSKLFSLSDPEARRTAARVRTAQEVAATLEALREGRAPGAFIVDMTARFDPASLCAEMDRQRDREMVLYKAPDGK